MTKPILILMLLKYLVGGASIDKYGLPLTDETLKKIKQSDA